MTRACQKHFGLLTPPTGEQPPGSGPRAAGLPPPLSPLLPPTPRGEQAPVSAHLSLKLLFLIITSFYLPIPPFHDQGCGQAGRQSRSAKTCNLIRRQSFYSRKFKIQGFDMELGLSQVRATLSGVLHLRKLCLNSRECEI